MEHLLLFQTIINVPQHANNLFDYCICMLCVEFIASWFFSLFTHSQAILFIYDITNYSSFENLEDWLSEVNRICLKSQQPQPHLALVANKSKYIINY